MDLPEGLVAAVDLGGTKIRSLVVDRAGTIRAVDERPTGASERSEVVVGRITESLRASLAPSGISLSGLNGIGVSAPGPVDFERGVVVEAPNLAGWHDVPLAAMLHDRFGLPTSLENDANAAAVGEHRWGAGRGVREMIYLTISTGIGGGLILNGQLYRGVDGTAGELGHVVVDQNGPLHSCGQRGCLEVMASGTAIARMAREARILNKDRLSRGEIPHAAIAEPARSRLHVDSLCDGEFSARALDVVAECERVGSDRLRIGECPAMFPQTIDVLSIGGMDIQRDLERFSGPV